MASLHLIWKDQRLTLITKLRVYQALVLSLLLYATQTCTLLATDMKPSETFHMNSQRQILITRCLKKRANFGKLYIVSTSTDQF